MKLIILCTCLSLLFAGSLLAQDYVGSDACQPCHSSNFNSWAESGHHFKLNPVSGGPPEYPFSEVPNPPEPYTWDDISYVIGGYYWKARFMDLDGYIITGDSTQPYVQYNLQDSSWSTYHTGEVKQYNCGRCHTTGYDTTGHQGGLEGIVGTWAEPGLGCEACHGPGSDHVSSMDPNDITLDESAELCGGCHYRDDQYRIPYKNGFIRHHEQYEEFYRSPHYDYMTCVSVCHDPHKSTVYDQGGLQENFACTLCHSGNYLIEDMESIDCWECHMTDAAKSAIAPNDYTGDVASHIFNIITDPVPRDSVVYEDNGTWYMELDSEGHAQLTLDWVCLSCHGDSMTLQEASDFATDIHTAHASAVGQTAAQSLPTSFAITSAYPNPFNPNTVVEFTLDKPYFVQADLYDVAGKLVSAVYSGKLAAGTHHLGVEGSNLTSGIYFLRLRADQQIRSIKLALMK